MDTIAIVFMVLILSLVWGGFFYFLNRAFGKGKKANG